MLPDSQIMTQHTSRGEILAIGVLEHYGGNLMLHRGGKEGSKVAVNRWFKSWYPQEALGTVTTGEKDILNSYITLQ